MKRKKILVVGTTLLLVVGVYAYVYRDWFHPTDMQIYHRPSAGRAVGGQARANRVPAGAAVAFGFDRAYVLKDVEIVDVEALKTNRAAVPLWHLVSDSNSVPVKGFIYGERIRGMRPFVKGMRAESLQSNVTYRLIVKTDRLKGQHDFKIGSADSSDQ
jgi:hypothetical protein